MPGALKRCPRCDRVSDQPLCPNDGTRTLLLDRPLADPSLLAQGYLVGGRYALLRLIGRGGYGAVFAARHTGTGQEVAVKVLIKSPGPEHKDAVRYFLREAQVTARLRHPNTIRVFDFGEDDAGFLYLVMELLTGKSLADTLQERVEAGEVFSQREAINIGIGITRSLAEAHAAGLVHRDLKPDNIFFHQVPGDEPIVKVLDFGIVKIQDHQHTGVRGTPLYMSPEQVSGKPLDQRSDLYSLGMVLFKLVCGALPFKSASIVETMRMQVREPAPDLRARARTPVSDAFAALIAQLLAKEPSARPSDARTLRAALEACDGRAAEATPDARSMPMSLSMLEAPRRAGLTLALLFVAGLSAAAGLSYLAVRGWLQGSTKPSVARGALQLEPAPAKRAPVEPVPIRPAAIRPMAPPLSSMTSVAPGAPRPKRKTQRKKPRRPKRQKRSPKVKAPKVDLPAPPPPPPSVLKQKI